jgi:hypothetical protein
VDKSDTAAMPEGADAMKMDDDDQTAASESGAGAEGRTESATARVRRILIEPLSGLARPKGLQAGQHADNLDRLARKLRHMDELGLRALLDLCLGQSGLVAVPRRAVPVCPRDAVILAWAYALQAPPTGQSDYPRVRHAVADGAPRA